MNRSMTIVAALLLSLVGAACEDPKPAMSGRLRTPTDIEMFINCPQNNPECEIDRYGHHLLLMTNAMSDDLRIFDADRRAFFKAYNPLFPYSIPVGRYPISLALDPYGEYAFVVNGLSEDVSLVDLASDRMVEVDTDGDQSTAASSLNCPTDPDPKTAPLSDRCLAGVSRVSLGMEEQLLPEQIAVPKGLTPDDENPDILPWDRTLPLPAFVSLTASGQVAFLEFSYPVDGGQPQLLTHVESVDVGGMPSGLAVTSDGATLFVADEASDSIAVVDVASRAVERILMTGPSRRVYLTPDDSTVYVFSQNDNRISIVDVATRMQVPTGVSDREESWDPEGDGMDIVLPGIPRELTFVTGHSIDIQGDDDTVLETHPVDSDETVGLFAYVSDLNGNVYIIDAVNHMAVDIRAVTGPTVSLPAYVLGRTVLAEEELNPCVGREDCDYPHIAEYDRVYGVDGEEESIFHGIRTRNGVTRSEGWILTWEGILTGTEASDSGTFNGWNLVDERMGVDFIYSGVRDYDLLEITSPQALNPDGSGTPHPACISDISNEPLSIFMIERVYGDTLDLASVPGIDLGLCWPEAASYEVRVRGAWTVLGLVSGPQERMEMIPFQDPPPETPVYDNGLIALTMFAPGPDDEGNPREVVRDSAWGFTSDDQFLTAQFAPSIRAGMAGNLIAVDMDDGAIPDRSTDSGLTGPADDRVYLLFESSNALMEFFPDNLSSTNYLLFQ